MKRTMERTTRWAVCLGAITLAGHLPVLAQTPGTWSAAGSMNESRDNFGSAPLPGGRVLVAGGVFGASQVLASAEIYDPLTGTWTLTAPMHLPREHLTLTRMGNGMLLATGGNNTPTGAPLASAEVYVPAIGKWRWVRPMATGRYFHAATLLDNGMVMVSGGCDQSSCATVTDSVEIFDPTTTSWHDGGTLAFARDYHTSTLLSDGRVLVTGGYGYSGALAEAEVWDPATNSWSTAGSMAVVRSTHAAVALPGGRVLVMGGSGNGSFLSSCELYDPRAGPSGSWLLTAPMAYKRQYVTAAALADGRVLVSGGWANTAPHVQEHIPFCEIYDARTGQWTPTGSLRAARSGHNAVLLRDHDMLIMGGIGTAGYLSSAERYAH